MYSFSPSSSWLPFSQTTSEGLSLAVHRRLPSGSHADSVEMPFRWFKTTRSRDFGTAAGCWRRRRRKRFASEHHRNVWYKSGWEVPLKGEEGTPPTLLPGPFAGSSEPPPEPRKRARKIKWLETKKEPSLKLSKKMRVLLPPLPKEPTVKVPEGSLAGPSYAFLQGAPSVCIRVANICPSDASAAGPLHCRRNRAAWPQHVWADPPSEPKSAAILQEPLLYISVQQVTETSKVLATGEGVAAHTAVAGAWPRESQLRLGAVPFQYV